MQHKNYTAAQHEAKHALVAHHLGYEVLSCSMVATEVLLQLSKGSLRRNYLADPLGTGYEVERICAVGLANGKDTSPGDRAALASWAYYWPGDLAAWKIIEWNARELVLDWEALASTRRSVTAVTVALLAAGRLQGAPLHAALRAATQGPGVAPLMPMRPVVPAKAFARVPLDWRTGSFPLTLRRFHVA